VLRSIFSRLNALFAAALLSIAVGCWPQAAQADPAAGASAVRQALTAQDDWLGVGGKRERWHKFLRNDVLTEQVELAADADPAKLAQVLKQYNAQANGLELAPFVRVRQAISDWRRQLAPVPNELAELALAARDDLQADHAGDVISAGIETSRRRLATAAVRLEQALVPGSQQGEAWKEYLRWQGVQPQLSPGARLDRRSLRTTLDQLSTGAEGLERPEFRTAAGAIQQLDDWARLARSRNPVGVYRKRQTDLAEFLTRDPQALDSFVGHKIEEQYDFLVGLGQSPQFIAALKRELVQPNIYGATSQQFLNQIAQRPVAEVRPIRDSILGTRITGSGDTRGTITLRLAPSVGSARLNFLLSGAIASSTRGVNGPVVICSAGDTCFQGTKTVELTDDSFRILPAGVRASTQSRTRSIRKTGGRLGKRLVESIARKKVAESRGQANAIASRKAETQISEEFNEQVVEEVRLARQQYDNRLRKPLRRRGAGLQNVVLSTTESQLQLVALEANSRQLGAPGAPPTAPGGDVALRLHQSALNNLAEAFLGGATIQRRAADKPTEIDAVLPKRLRESIANQASGDEPQQAFRPWKIVLRRKRPLTFLFNAGQATAIIHTALIEVDKGDDEKATFKDWDLHVTYQPVRQAGQWYAELKGGIQAFPTEFDRTKPGARMKSGPRAIRQNLATQFTKRAEEDPNFPRRVKLGPLDLARLEKPGLHDLVLQSVLPADGWLSLSFMAQ